MGGDADLASRLRTLEGDVAVLVDAVAAVVLAFGALNAHIEDLVELRDIEAFRARVDELERDIEGMHDRIIHRWPEWA